MENGDGNDVVGGKDEAGGDEVDAAAAAVPHPNVVRYYGCVLKDERITHLCLQRCYCNLAEYAEVGLSSEETDELLGQVQEGLKFLHGLGLAHNDIHPGEYFSLYSCFFPDLECLPATPPPHHRYEWNNSKNETNILPNHSKKATYASTPTATPSSSTSTPAPPLANL